MIGLTVGPSLPSTSGGSEAVCATGVPRLVIGDCAEPAPPDPLTTGVEACRDARGGVVAYCGIVNGQPRIDVPDLATFTYERDGEQVRARPHRPLPPETVRETYHHCVVPVMLPALGTEVVHASAVVAAAGVAAFCGASGAGKSTLAVGLARRGYALWADDAVAIDTSGPRPRTMPLPFEVRLRPASARFFGPGFASTAVTPAGTEALPLAVLCMLRRSPDVAGVAVERLDPASACLAALGHAYCFSVEDRAQRRRTIARYLWLAGHVPAYEVRFRPGLDRFSAVLDALEEVVGRAPTASG